MEPKKNSFFQIDPNRNYGIELLRILAMFMVVVLHVLGKGGIVYSQTVAPANYWTAWALEIAAYGAVDVYALISGFVGYRAKHKYASLAELWLRVWVYSVSFTVLNRLFFNPQIGMKKILFSFFPVTKGELWYFTMYFALYLLSPVLNAAAEALPRKTFRNVVVASVFLFSVLPFLWVWDVFELAGGSSLMWLIVLYLIGAYIGKYRAFEKMKRRVALAGFFACVVMTWASKFLIQTRFTSFLGQTNNSDWLVNYTSLTVVLSAVFLLCLFRSLQPPVLVKKIAAVAAPLSFSVYVIHMQPLFRTHFLDGRYAVYGTYSPAVMALAVLGTAAAIYLACSALDFIRARLFRLLKVKKRLLHAEEKLLGRFLK